MSDCKSSTMSNCKAGDAGKTGGFLPFWKCSYAKARQQLSISKRAGRLFYILAVGLVLYVVLHPMLAGKPPIEAKLSMSSKNIPLLEARRIGGPRWKWEEMWFHPSIDALAARGYDFVPRAPRRLGIEARR